MNDPDPDRPWEITVASNADSSHTTAPRYWIRMRVRGLQEFVQVRYDEKWKLEARYCKDHPVSFPMRQLAAIRAFQERLRHEATGSRKITIWPHELPILSAFNDRKFRGLFIDLTCWSCGLTSTPEQTHIRDFAEKDGMRAYGKLRCCSCGKSFAYKLEGQLMP